MIHFDIYILFWVSSSELIITMWDKVVVSIVVAGDLVTIHFWCDM